MSLSPLLKAVGFVLSKSSKLLNFRTCVLTRYGSYNKPIDQQLRNQGGERWY
jgi:hypothetical protein